MQVSEERRQSAKDGLGRIEGVQSEALNLAEIDEKNLALLHASLSSTTSSSRMMQAQDIHLNAMAENPYMHQPC